MFDPSAMTILVQAAGGSGSWRMWHYSVLDDSTLDDVKADGFFNPMAEHIESNSIVYVSAKAYVAQMVLRRDGLQINTAEMTRADFPREGGADPKRQLLPGGSRPTAGTDTRGNEAKDTAGTPVEPTSNSQP